MRIACVYNDVVLQRATAEGLDYDFRELTFIMTIIVHPVKNAGPSKNDGISPKLSSMCTKSPPNFNRDVLYRSVLK